MTLPKRTSTALFLFVVAFSAAPLSLFDSRLRAEEPQRPDRMIGYTELQTNLPGGRHANVRTMRAIVMNADGSGRRLIAEELADAPNAWTQFAGWSPDGKQAIVYRGWQNPENAEWEEQNKRFRMQPGSWLLDSCLVELATAKVHNLTAIDRVSHYNGGLFFLPNGRGLGFTPLINGVSKPFVMDLDGRNKRDVSGKDDGFAYGYSASPDGKLISYHERYQIYIANADGSNKRRIETGNPFNFGPLWSPDGEWLLFVSGVHGRSNPYVVRRNGTGLRKLVDIGNYQGWVAFLDVPDFHQGSSDTPVWSADGKSVFYTAKVDQNVELFQATLDGAVTQLTKSERGSLHYHPQPSPDGQWLLYGSKRDGVRQLYMMHLADRRQIQLTDLQAGHGAMWPHWQPATRPNVFAAASRRSKTWGDSEKDFFLKRDQGILEIHLDGKPLGSFFYKHPKVKRPFFAHVKTVGGIQVTRRYPPVEGQDPTDHADMHPGLWLAFARLNDISFWHNSGGRVVHEGFESEPTAGAAAAFVTRDSYVAPNGEVLCRQRTHYRISRDPAGWLIDWDAEWSSDKPFWFGVREEMGLGVRVASPLRVRDGAGSIVNSAGQRNEKGTWGNVAKWWDYSGLIHGRGAGVMIMSAPGNPKVWSHSRDYGLLVANPFPVDLPKNRAKRLTIEPGETFRLRFGILIHDQAPSSDFSENEAWERYLQTAKAP